MAERRRGPLNVARIWARENVITTVLIIFILISLLLHALTIGALVRVRGITDRQLEISANDIARVRQQKVQYTFPIDQSFTVDTTIAVSDTITVPISLSVPIKQNVKLPIETDFGTFDFDVPIDIEVPISDTLAIPIKRDIPFKADIPVKTSVPIELNLNDPPLGTILQQLEEAIRELRDQL